jgi:hypothetical protein
MTSGGDDNRNEKENIQIYRTTTTSAATWGRWAGRQARSVALHASQHATQHAVGNKKHMQTKAARRRRSHEQRGGVYAATQRLR